MFRHARNSIHDVSNDILASANERTGREIWYSPARTKAATRSSTSEDLMLILDGECDFLSSTSSSYSSYSSSCTQTSSLLQSHLLNRCLPDAADQRGMKELIAGWNAVLLFQEQIRVQKGDAAVLFVYTGRRDKNRRRLQGHGP